MGFDPQAPSGSAPFLNGENHLELAYQAGLGTHHIQDIPIIGPSIAEALYRFKPSP
jgi:hypothetical protein